MIDYTDTDIIPSEISVGMVGAGLMGRSIAACLLASGHTIIVIVLGMEEEQDVKEAVRNHLDGLEVESTTNPKELMGKMTISDDYHMLSQCGMVLEVITEDVEAKKEVYRKIEEVVSDEVPIGSNTSAIPVTLLQEGAKHPERFVGIHWGEPAHIMRFMEIICGKQTDVTYGHFVKALAEQ